MTNKFSKDQTYLNVASMRRADVNRQLNYPHLASYEVQAKDELVRLDAAIVDIKSRLTKDEIKESEYVSKVPFTRA